MTFHNFDSVLSSIDKNSHWDHYERKPRDFYHCKFDEYDKDLYFPVQKEKQASGNDGKIVDDPRSYKKLYKKKDRLIDLVKIIEKSADTGEIIKVNPQLKKDYAPYTNQDCYDKLNKLGASLSNEKEIFQAMMNNPQLLNQLPIDPLQPVIYILKAWHKEGAKRSIKNSCRHNNNNLHIEARAVDIQLDWIVEDDLQNQRSRPKAFSRRQRYCMLRRLLELAEEAGFSYGHLDNKYRFIHLSCPYTEPTLKKERTVSVFVY